MSRRKRHYKRERKPLELDVTTFLNLMVVLIPFLLATAVFSQVNIQELNLPEAAAGGAAQNKPVVTIEVMVRKTGLEISDGKHITDRFPIKNGMHDYVGLSEALRVLKNQHPEKKDVSVLLEPDIEYNDMIAVMDAVKVIPLANAPINGEQYLALFTEISVGDAP